MTSPRWRAALERAIAAGYAATYDVVVERFPPYEALRTGVSELVARSASPPARVLDVACGIGNVCLHVARMGYAVRGFDQVPELVEVARTKQRALGSPVDAIFAERDIARDPVSDKDAYDVLISMNTLYWHPEPEALLRACRAALKPSGYAIFVTYGRRPRVLRTAWEVRAASGVASAVHAFRWLVPTAVFDVLRDCEPRYLSRDAFHGLIEAAGFEILEAREAFLAGICHIAWARPKGPVAL